MRLRIFILLIIYRSSSWAAGTGWICEITWLWEQSFHYSRKAVMTIKKALKLLKEPGGYFIRKHSFMPAILFGEGGRVIDFLSANLLNPGTWHLIVNCISKYVRMVEKPADKVPWDLPNMKQNSDLSNRLLTLIFILISKSKRNWPVLRRICKSIQKERMPIRAYHAPLPMEYCRCFSIHVNSWPRMSGSIRRWLKMIKLHSITFTGSRKPRLSNLTRNFQTCGKV